MRNAWPRISHLGDKDSREPGGVEVGLPTKTSKITAIHQRRRLLFHSLVSLNTLARGANGSLSAISSNTKITEHPWKNFWLSQTESSAPAWTCCQVELFPAHPHLQQRGNGAKLHWAVIKFCSNALCKKKKKHLEIWRLRPMFELIHLCHYLILDRFSCRF